MLEGRHDLTHVEPVRNEHPLRTAAPRRKPLERGIQIEVVEGLTESDKVKNPNTDLQGAGATGPTGATGARRR